MLKAYTPLSIGRGFIFIFFFFILRRKIIIFPQPIYSIAVKKILEKNLENLGPITNCHHGHDP